MNQRLPFALGAFLQAAVGLALPSALTAQITVLTSGGFVDAYQELRPTFEKAHKVTITTLRGASQGPGPNTIGAQLRRGVHVDVVIGSRDGLKELIAEAESQPERRWTSRVFRWVLLCEQERRGHRSTPLRRSKQRSCPLIRSAFKAHPRYT